MNSMPSSSRVFEDELARALRRTHAESKRIILAVSGGSDSIAMMTACAALKLRLSLTLEVATVDHGLRTEAATETAFVAAAAHSLGLTTHVLNLSLAPGAGTPERARTARYEALEQLCDERTFDLIATAHTASDQAETLLMRLGRGASLTGAAAIRQQRGRLVRPMLGVTRSEVLGYLEARQLSWVEDPTNADPHYLRTEVRTRLLPLYEELMGPGVAQRLAHFARVAAEDGELLDSQAPSGDDAPTREQLLNFTGPMRRRVLRNWLLKLGLPVDGPLLEDVVLAVIENRRATLPGDKVLEVKGGVLAVVPAPPRSNG